MSTIKIHTFQEDFITESGEIITNPILAYQTWGILNNTQDNVIIISHALTGNTNAKEWFSGLFQDRGIIDLKKHFVICINHPGSCYGSIGPTSINRNTGEIYKANFPNLTIRDIVKLEQQLLDKLHINKVDLIIGGSMGGMVALEFCLIDPRIQSACLIAMGKSHSAWAIGISEAQRLAIQADKNWDSGFYKDESPPIHGLAAAHEVWL